jgi:FemAB-related protein (PEP-CTERM system-associated)
MTTIIKRLKFRDEPRWDSFALNHEDSTFYHQCKWKNAIEETYKHKSYYIFSENDIGKVTGIFPMFLIKDIFSKKRLISIPFAPYGGICCESEREKAALVQEAKNIARELGASILELRGYNDGYDKFNVIRDYSTFKLDLSNGSQHIWNNLEKTVRTAVRKGEKKGLKFEMDQDEQAIADFYDIYSENMKFLGTPAHDFSFFTRIQKISPDDIFIAKVKYADTVISSLFLMRFKDTLIYGWGSSLHSYLKLAPNNYIHWNSIRCGIDYGLFWYDFGRSVKDSGNYKFKKRWGGIEIPINIYIYPENKKISIPQKKFKRLAPIWSQLPSNISKYLGPKIRKYIV